MRALGAFILHTLLVIILTVVTQIGGLIYIICLLVFKRFTLSKWIFKPLIFIAVYLTVTIGVVPFIAPLFGREKIVNTENLSSHNYFYILANRNYVRPALNDVLGDISSKLANQYPGIQIKYLDANFPFINGFSLLPHLSHNDGKKVDITLLYESPDGTLTNAKKSFSGYGVFEGATSKEHNQSDYCKSKGYWQYDFTKYTSIVSYNDNYSFSVKANRYLSNLITSDNRVGKVFIEPHLKRRMGLQNAKIRFHGCGAVRHDDHFHLQLK